MVRESCQLPTGSVEHDLGRDFSFAQDPTDFLNGQVFRVMKAQNGVGICRQSVLGQLPERAESRWFVPEGFIDRVTWQGNLSSTVLTTDLIECKPARNGEEPWEEGSVAIVLLDLSISP